MSWEGMLSKFRTLVSSLYEEWQVDLMQSLTPPAKTYFESILNKTATEDDLTDSLYQLSSFLTKKFRQKVIVLIDEYEVPNHCAYELGYFNEVRFSICLFYDRLELRTSIPGQSVFWARCTSFSLEGDHD